MSYREVQPVLRTQIVSYLLANPKVTAVEIARALGVPKKRINAELYRHDEFQSDGATRSRWTVAAPATTARPVKKPVAKQVDYVVGAASDEDHSVLRAQIARYLMSKPSATATDIADALVVSKKWVNAQLYRYDEFQSDDAERPRWTVSASAHTPTQPDRADASQVAPEKSIAHQAGPKKLPAKRPLSARDMQMIEMRADGRTLQEIGDRFNLTRERVRQLLKRHDHAIQDVAQSRLRNSMEAVAAGLAEGKSIPEIAKLLGLPVTRVESLLALRTDDTRTSTGMVSSYAGDLIADRVKAFLLENPGLTLQEVAEASGCSRSFIKRAVPSLARRLTVPEESDGRAASEKVWSDAQILVAIKRAATYEYPLTAKHFDHLRSIGEVSAPSVPLVHVRFGGWRAACEAAGVESGDPLRDSYESRWTDADLLRFAGQFLADESSDGTYRGFEKWLAQDVDRPSVGTVRNRLGGWIEIKRAALTADWFKGMLREHR